MMTMVCIPAAGDAASGRALFESKGACLTCHVVDGHGGSLGPDLSKIGVIRTVRSLRLSLVDPDVELDKRYFTVVVTNARGEAIRGVALNEDDLSIQIRDSQGNLRSFLKKDRTSVPREQRSLMPPHTSRVSEAEIGDLDDYLHTLRGPTPRITPRTRRPHHAYSSVAFLDRL